MAYYPPAIQTSAQLAAQLSDETGTGANVFATGPTITLANGTGLPISTGVSGLGTGIATFLATPSSANFASAMTDETGSGSNVFATSPTLVTPVLGTPSSATLNDSLTYGHDLTAVPNQTGGWTEYFVTASDATTTATTQADIAGLVSGTLSASTRYEIEAVLAAASSSAAGFTFSIHDTATGSAAVPSVVVSGMTSTSAAAASVSITAIDTATSALATAGGSTIGAYLFKGFVVTGSTGTPAISIRYAKVTSGTATVKVGSVMRVRKAHT